MTESQLRVRVSDKYPIAQDTVAIELMAEDDHLLPVFSAGAYIDVDLGFGPVRQYSLANDPAERHRYLLGILKQPGSNGTSAALNDIVQPTNSITISPPKNLFPLDEDAGFTVLVGGGIGITPMLAFGHRLHRLGRPFELHFCARSHEHAPFVDTLNQLPFYDQIQLHFDDHPDSKMQLARQLVSAPGNTHLYVCGPKGFMDAVLVTANQHLPANQVHQESFDAEPDPVTPSQTSPAVGNLSFEVTLTTTGETLKVPANRSLLEVLQQHGVPISRNCPRSFCCSCAVTVLEGEVDHRDVALPDQQRNELGQMLSCVSRAKSKRLVLDL